MGQQPIRFNDAAAYERMMAVWSRRAGQVFIDWLSPGTGQRWIDVGCGSGAFAELLIQHCAPVEVQGVDPSEAQISFARTKPGTASAVFQQGDAMALPFDTGRFDAAIMALVIFFVPEPAKGVAEMTRVVRPGGLVAAYAWDALGDGSPTEPILAEMPGLGIAPVLPPSADASRLQALRELWTAAGLEAIETREITVQRSFADFDDFWNITTGSTLKATFSGLAASTVEQLKERVRLKLPVDAQGQITCRARANAVKGRVPNVV